jgi:hypothetical protein
MVCIYYTATPNLKRRTTDGMVTAQSPLHAVRNALDSSLFEMIAGPDGRAQRARIHRAPGPRWFAEDRPIRRVHADASMFIGGLRALLLQSLHPLAMAGGGGTLQLPRRPLAPAALTAGTEGTAVPEEAESAARPFFGDGGNAGAAGRRHPVDASRRRLTLAGRYHMRCRFGIGAIGRATVLVRPL